MGSAAEPAAAPPVLQFLWQAEVDIGDRQDLGPCTDGHRYRVPILGGTFAGPQLGGRVLPGGADHQLVRPDGLRELRARYDMQADDGSVLNVHNHVLVDPLGPGSCPARSVMRLRIADGPWVWLSRRVLVGTLESLRPARAAVRVRAYLLA